MVNNCSLCSTIWSSKEEYQKQFEWHHDEGCAIVMEDEEPCLYVPCEDWFYSDTIMEINYCPKCGRKINPKYKVMR